MNAENLGFVPPEHRLPKFVVQQIGEIIQTKFPGEFSPVSVQKEAPQPNGIVYSALPNYRTESPFEDNAFQEKLRQIRDGRR